MTRLVSVRRNQVEPMKLVRWTLVIILWAASALLAYFYRTDLAGSTAGVATLVVIFAPLGLVLYFLAHALGEGTSLLLLLMAFKVVTLGKVRTGLTRPGQSFRWHGFARASDGALVASENAMALVAITAYATVGLALYLTLA